MLQAIYDGVKGTHHANLMQLPTDCPQRDERLGWMGDASLSADAFFANFHYGPFAAAFVTESARACSYYPSSQVQKTC